MWMGTQVPRGRVLRLFLLEEKEGGGLEEKKVASTPLDSMAKIGQVELKFCRSDSLSSSREKPGPFRALLRVVDKIYVVWRGEDPDVVEVGIPEATGVAAFCPAPGGALLLREDRRLEHLKLT